MERTKHTILSGDDETSVYHLEAPSDGPTAVIVGGMHGNERAGIRAAELVRLWTISSGEIIVIPQANKQACDRGTRQAPGRGDLNRQFPTDSAPEGSVAKGLWKEITRHDPDYVFDLHRSVGLYQRSPEGVGMAIYPTPGGRGIAEDALGHMNEDHVPDGNAEFRVGNDQSGHNPLLSHKVGGDLDPPVKGWLIETTSHQQSLPVRVEQLEHSIETVLYHADDGGGITVDDYGHVDQEPKDGILDEYDDPNNDESPSTVLEHEQPLRAYHQTIGGSAGSGTHGGDVPKPDGMPSRSDADYHVRNYSQLKSAVTDDGAIVYIDDDINMSRKGEITLADGVTIVGQYCDPDVDGPGNELYHEDNDANDYNSFFRHHPGGEPAKLYGVSMRGPREYTNDPDHEADDFEDLLVYGIWDSANANDGTFEAVGCRFTGWTHAGIVLGARNHKTDGEIRRCAFHMNNTNHYGYGLEQYNGDLWVDRCFFDQCRHWTAGFGYPDEETHITNCVGGRGPGLSHAWDKHGLHNNLDTDDLTAGHHLRMKNCTTMQTELPDGRPQEAVKIRGITVEESWFRDCHFYHDSPPDSNRPNRNQVIRQEHDEWNNVSWANNHYGPDDPPDGIGAPLAAEDIDEPNRPAPDNGADADKPTMEYPFQRLTIHGGDERCDYKFEISGAAETAKDEPSDSVSSIDGGSVIEGYVFAEYTDEYHIEPGAVINKAKFDGACTVDIDGHAAQLGSAISTGLNDEGF